MNVLAINSGSSSLKFRAINTKSEKLIVKGTVSKINSEESILSVEIEETFVKKIKCKINNHKEAVKKIAEILRDENFDFNTILGIGHRIVHGGSIFKNSVLVNDDVIKKIENISLLAPLHNKTQLETLKATREIFKNKKEVAVFDTAFYSCIEPHVYMYALPYKYYEKYDIRKYGFHGMSHTFVSEKYASITNKNLKNLKIITCHLGSGSSITAIKNSKVIDTSMGFTPLDGLIMSTRCGSIDASIITFLEKKENLSSKEIEKILNTKSGFLGISGISGDIEIIKDSKEKKSILAINMLKHQVIKTIGSYIAIMDGCDAIVFTAGIGENYYSLREDILKNFSYLNLKLDKNLNKKMINRKQGKISSVDSKIDVFVIPTNEEIIIARETKNLIENFSKENLRSRVVQL